MSHAVCKALRCAVPEQGIPNAGEHRIVHAPAVTAGASIPQEDGFVANGGCAYAIDRCAHFDTAVDFTLRENHGIIAHLREDHRFCSFHRLCSEHLHAHGAASSKRWAARALIMPVTAELTLDQSREMVNTFPSPVRIYPEFTFTAELWLGENTVG
jgi:hypothetical protein